MGQRAATGGHHCAYRYISAHRLGRDQQETAARIAARRIANAPEAALYKSQRPQTTRSTTMNKNDHGNTPNWLTFINTAILGVLFSYAQNIEKRIATMEANTLLIMQSFQLEPRRPQTDQKPR